MQYKLIKRTPVILFSAIFYFFSLGAISFASPLLHLGHPNHNHHDYYNQQPSPYNDYYSNSYRNPYQKPILNHRTPSQTIVSPKPGWNANIIDTTQYSSNQYRGANNQKTKSITGKILLWPVNRILDLIDIFRIDVGVGTSIGGVVRLTKSGSAGYRDVPPGSLRLGNFGRGNPIIIEEHSEWGFADNYTFSPDREVCLSEIGLGLDLGLGGYIGVCPEHILDFFGGLVLIDSENDDL